jgi:purine-binding chemotaxis protein CheW
MNRPTFEQRLQRFFYDPEESSASIWAANEELAPPRSIDETPEEFLAFDLGQESYAIPIAMAREILKPGHITPVPHAPPNVLGMVNVRGEMLPLFDLKPRLKHPSLGLASRNRNTRILLVKDLEGDVALWVDDVRGVVKLPLSKLEATPSLGFERDIIAGLARHEGALYILLDVSEALK